MISCAWRRLAGRRSEARSGGSTHSSHRSRRLSNTTGRPVQAQPAGRRSSPFALRGPRPRLDELHVQRGADPAMPPADRAFRRRAPRRLTPERLLADDSRISLADIPSDQPAAERTTPRTLGFGWSGPVCPQRPAARLAAEPCLVPAVAQVSMRSEVRDQGSNDRRFRSFRRRCAEHDEKDGTCADQHGCNQAAKAARDKCFHRMFHRFLLRLNRNPSLHGTIATDVPSCVAEQKIVGFSNIGLQIRFIPIG
jgi:hypothetical protein